jgi:hypothetical protein
MPKMIIAAILSSFEAVISLIVSKSQADLLQVRNPISGFIFAFIEYLFPQLPGSKKNPLSQRV